MQQIGKEDYIAHCLKTMTLISMDEKEIFQNINEIEDQSISVDSSKEEQMFNISNKPINNYADIVTEGIKHIKKFIE